MSRIDDLASRLSARRTELERKVGERTALTAMAEASEGVAAKALARKEVLRKACILAEALAEVSRRDLRAAFGDVATQALRGVLGEGYKIHVVHEVKRDRSTADFCVVSDDYNEPADPMISRGGGVIDVMSVALRVVVAGLVDYQGPIFLDEPFRHLSADRVEDAARFLLDACRKFGRQMIVVTHHGAFAEVADTVISLPSG